MPPEENTTVLVSQETIQLVGELVAATDDLETINDGIEYAVRLAADAELDEMDRS
jgi:hypothetical protein